MTGRRSWYDYSTAEVVVEERDPATGAWIEIARRLSLRDPRFRAALAPGGARQP